VLTPLDVDLDLPPLPWGVEDEAMPVGPDFCRRATRVVAHPDDLFVSGDGEGNPGAVHIVAPQHVVRDDAAGRVDDGDDSAQREPFVSLPVQRRCQTPRASGLRVGRGKRGRNVNRSDWNVCVGTAPDCERRREGDRTDGSATARWRRMTDAMICTMVGHVPLKDAQVPSPLGFASFTG
jgi:hypothetical protein